MHESNLTAFHETTRQPRAKISLLKATKLIDDKTALLKPDGKQGKGRRKSGFGDEDQAYMFVEEGFRIRFANGEAIDFYADSAAEKDKWMEALAGVVGNSGVEKKMLGWCDVVLKREKLLQQLAEQNAQSRPRSQDQDIRPKTFAQSNSYSGSIMLSMKSQPSSPVKAMVPRGLGIQGTVPMRQAEIIHPPVGPASGRLNSRRKQVRSMIF